MTGDEEIRVEKNGDFTSPLLSTSDQSSDNTSMVDLQGNTLSELRPRESSLSSSNRTIRTVQYCSVLVSLAVSIYFVAFKDELNVSLQYIQVCFISVLTLILDATTTCRQHLWLVIGICVGIFWGVVTIWSCMRDLDYGPMELFFALLASLPFFGGLLACAHVATSNKKSTTRKVELDLLLYLISLNGICFFSENNFNNNLHMILDIRTIVLLYNALHQPRDKMDLLQSWSFVSIMVLIIVTFIVYSRVTSTTDLVGNVFYFLIGLLLSYEAYIGYHTLLECKSESK